MTRAASNVAVTLTLRGQDKASRSINRVGKASGRAGVSINSLAKSAALAAGAFAAIGASVAAVKRLTEMAEEAARLRASLDFAGGGQGGFQRMIDLADKIGGVGVESVGRFTVAIRNSGVLTRFTAEQLQKLTGVALTAGKTGDDAMTAVAQAIENANTRSLKSIGIFINNSRVQKEYADALGKTTTELTALEQRQAVATAVQEKLNKATATANETHKRLDESLADLGNRFVELKVAIAKAASPALSAFVRQMSAATKATVGLINAVRKAPQGLLERFGNAAMGMMGAAQMTPEARARLQRQQGFLKFRQQAREAPGAGQFMQMLRGAGQQLQQAGAGAARGFGQVGEAFGGAAASGRRMVGDIAGRFSQQRRAQQERAKEAARVRAEREDRLQETLLDEVELIDRLKQEEINAMTEAANREFDLLFERKIRKQEMHDAEMSRIEKEKTARMDLNFAIARGVVGVANVLIESEKALAPIKLAMALGEAAIAFLRGKTPAEKASAVAAGAVAVAQFGKVMSGGAGGAGASLPSPGGGAGPGMVGAGASGQSAPTVVVNFGQGVVLGTPAEIARSIKGTFAAAHNTGF